MTTEQRNERNRKRRERRAEKNKALDNLDAPIAAQVGDGFVPEDEDDENSEWLHRGNWNQNMECLRVGTHNQDDVLNNGESTHVGGGDGNVASSISLLDESTHNNTSDYEAKDSLIRAPFKD